MKKRLAVIGVGSAGIVSLGHFCTWLDNSWEITSIYDPSIQTLGIGESTNSNFVTVLENAIDFTYELDIKELDATLKYGTKFIDWRDESWINPLIEGSVALHFNTNKLKDLALPRLAKKWPNKFKILEGTVSSLDQTTNLATVTVDSKIYEFDYVIDCRGFPEDYSNYIMSDCSLVNHCIVHDQEKFDPIVYTEHYATKNGWMFGVPLSNRKSYGYLYNDSITSKEDAISDMSKILKIPKSKLTTREYAFKPYYAKEVLEGRILKNGNRALFFEPISATSIYMYVRICKMFFEFLNSKYNQVDINQQFRNDLEDLEVVISYYYHGGSKYDTEFWEKSKTNAFNKLEGNCKFYYLVTELKRLYDDGTPFDFPGMIFPANPWFKLDRLFGYNYFTHGQDFKFNMDKVQEHYQMIKTNNNNEIAPAQFSSSEEFKKVGWLHLKNVIDQPTVDLVTTYALHDQGQNFSPEQGETAQIPGTHSKYADPLMEALLLRLHPVMESATGLKLHPTYSYYRVYKPGDILKPHKDRPSCEISTTVCFNFNYGLEQSTYNWPIFMEGAECIMEPGDLVVYHGCDLVHWRDEFTAPTGSWHVQAFFHYVDATGENAEYKFDRRPAIGYRKPAMSNNQLPAPTKKYITFTE